MSDINKKTTEKADAKIELDPALSDFISVVSHQVRSPLAAIKGFAGLLADGHYGKVSEEAREIILKIRSSSERALELADNLLDLKKIQEGKMHYNFGDHDVVKIVSDCVDDLKFLAMQKKLDLVFEPSEERIIGKVDKITFHQVIQNLIDNSIKYTHQGWIKVEVKKENKKIHIKISDSGQGMPKEALSSVFDKFVRSFNKEHHIKGSGLGLFIVKNIVEAHHGRVFAESEGEGKGSTFTVELPV